MQAENKWIKTTYLALTHFSLASIEFLKIGTPRLACLQSRTEIRLPDRLSLLAVLKERPLGKRSSIRVNLDD